MSHFNEQEIRDIVSWVIAQSGLAGGKPAAPEKSQAAPGKRAPNGQPVPVEVSARHVHLTKEALEVLFGPGYQLKRKRSLSQPGQYLCAERVKLVTVRGQLDNVAILGPLRDEIQVELSLTDARTLGVKAPICLSGDLEGAADVLIVGPAGVVTAKGSVMIAKAHVHMTPEDAARYGVSHGEHVSIRLGTERVLTLNDVIVRVSPNYALAVHIDFDEANAAQVSGDITGLLLRNR